MNATTPKTQKKFTLGKKEYSDYSFASYVFNYGKYEDDPKIALNLMIALINKQSTFYKGYNNRLQFDRDISCVVSKLIQTKGVIDINYKGDYVKEEYRYTPLTFALYYGFYDVVKALVNREDLDVNLIGQLGLCEVKTPASLIWYKFNDNMLKNGSYGKLLSRPDLKINKNDIYNICQILTNKCLELIESANKDELIQIVETLKIFKSLYNNFNVDEFSKQVICKNNSLVKTNFNKTFAR